MAAPGPRAGLPTSISENFHPTAQTSVCDEARVALLRPVTLPSLFGSEYKSLGRFQSLGTSLS